VVKRKIPSPRWESNSITPIVQLYLYWVHHRLELKVTFIGIER
jgi:hypothetical protein